MLRFETTERGRVDFQSTIRTVLVSGVFFSVATAEWCPDCHVCFRKIYKRCPQVVVSRVIEIYLYYNTVIFQWKSTLPLSDDRILPASICPCSVFECRHAETMKCQSQEGRAELYHNCRKVYHNSPKCIIKLIWGTLKCIIIRKIRPEVYHK